MAVRERCQSLERVIFPGDEHATRILEARSDMADRNTVDWWKDVTGEAGFVD